jgi:hypothetical protein
MVNTEVLQLIVGVYMVGLAVILTRYISIVESGPDDVELKLNIAKILPVCLVIFTAVLIGSRKLLGG